MLDQSAADKLKTIQLSNKTITDHSPRPGKLLQMDESTDTANHAILLVRETREQRFAGTISPQQRPPYHYKGRGHFQHCGLVFELSGPELGIMCGNQN